MAGSKLQIRGNVQIQLAKVGVAQDYMAG